MLRREGLFPGDYFGAVNVLFNHLIVPNLCYCRRLSAPRRSFLNSLPTASIRLAVVMQPGYLSLICWISESTEALVELTSLILDASCITGSPTASPVLAGLKH